MHFQHRRKRALPFRTIKPGEQRNACRAVVFEVFGMYRHGLRSGSIGAIGVAGNLPRIPDPSKPQQHVVRGLRTAEADGRIAGCSSQAIPSSRAGCFCSEITAIFPPIGHPPPAVSLSRSSMRLEHYGNFSVVHTTTGVLPTADGLPWHWARRRQCAYRQRGCGLPVANQIQEAQDRASKIPGRASSSTSR
jgi:hypothetical protein